MKSFKIIEILENYKNSGTVRFHMPGHSGRSFSSLLDEIYPYDVTELPFSDDLNAPETDGLFAEIEEYLKKITSAHDVIISCSGATSMIQTAIAAALRRKKGRVLCERAVHLSVVNSLALGGADVMWLKDVECELPDKITGGESCVIITSPDYYGKMHDTGSISQICKKYGVPLIVDSAHGAHLEFYKNGEMSAFKNGASLSALSLHKTLPSLTGAAILLSDGTFTKNELLYARRKFSSSSPSYLISLSIAECMRFMRNEGAARLDLLRGNVQHLKQQTGHLGFDLSADYAISDPFRIYIRTNGIISPAGLNEALIKEKIVCEFFDSAGIVLIPSILQDRADFDKVISVLKSAVNNAVSVSREAADTALSKQLPVVQMTMGEAFSVPFETVNIGDSRGRICAEPVYLYPPGIPIVMPGEIYGDTYIEYLKRMGITEVNAVKADRVGKA